MRIIKQKQFNCLQQKHVTLKRVTCNSFPWNKAGDFRTPILCQIWTKVRSKLHVRENARASLHPNKEILKTQKNPSSEPDLKRFKVMRFCLQRKPVFYWQQKHKHDQHPKTQYSKLSEAFIISTCRWNIQKTLINKKLH